SSGTQRPVVLRTTRHTPGLHLRAARAPKHSRRDHAVSLTGIPGKNLARARGARQGNLRTSLSVAPHHSHRPASWREWLEHVPPLPRPFDPELLGLPNVAALVPSFRFLLDDLAQMSDAALQSRARQEAEFLVPLVLWALRDGRHKERLLSSLVRWVPVVQAAWQSNEGQR